MAPSVRVLLVLAHLAVMVVGKHGLGRVQDKYQSDRCKKLMRMIMWCGSEKDWKNEIQRKMAAQMGGSNFTDEVDECLAASLDPDDQMSYCTDIKSLRVYLMCSRQTLFNRVHIGSKFAALMFHRGFEHCVKVNMGMMEADLGMSNDEETGPSDDDDDDEYYEKLERPKNSTPPRDKESDGRRRHNHRKGQYSRPVREQYYEVPDEFNRHRPYPEIHRPRRRVPYGDDDDGTYILHMWSSDDDEEVKQHYKWFEGKDDGLIRHDRLPDIKDEKKKHPADKHPLPDDDDHGLSERDMWPQISDEEKKHPVYMHPLPDDDDHGLSERDMWPQISDEEKKHPVYMRPLPDDDDHGLSQRDFWRKLRDEDNNQQHGLPDDEDSDVYKRFWYRRRSHERGHKMSRHDRHRHRMNRLDSRGRHVDDEYGGVNRRDSDGFGLKRQR